MPIFRKNHPRKNRKNWMQHLILRYFINIVGKYGVQVQNLLKKAATLDIQMICPLHGPILKENLGYYIGKYLTWSSYEPEEKGVVIACASIHGNTMIAAEKLAEILKAKGEKNVVLYDLARDDMPSAIADAYRYDRLVVAAASEEVPRFRNNLAGRPVRKPLWK